MADSDFTRRTVLKTAGVASVAALAGCSDDGGNGNGNGDGDEGVEIDPGETIEFVGNIGGWEGSAPSDIEGEENPTLILQADEDYTIGWTEGDGNGHNIEIRDEDENVVEDYETEVVEEPGDDQMLDITATDEMAYYVCNPHDNAMRGEIQVE